MTYLNISTLLIASTIDSTRRILKLEFRILRSERPAFSTRHFWYESSNLVLVCWRHGAHMVRDTLLSLMTYSHVPPNSLFVPGSMSKAILSVATGNQLFEDEANGDRCGLAVGSLYLQHLYTLAQPSLPTPFLLQACLVQHHNPLTSFPTTELARSSSATPSSPESAPLTSPTASANSITSGASTTIPNPG